jgi:hypothetical protein
MAKERKKKGYSPDANVMTNALVSYLHSEGRATNISDCGLEIGISDSGLGGVFATRPFKSGDCMCTIPASSCTVLHQGTDAVTDAQLAAIFIDRILEDPKAPKLYV